MYRSSSPQFSKFQHSYSAYNYDGPLHSPAGNQALQKLLRNNQDLQQRLNEQRSKNFDLLELKRRMQEDIRKLQFELDRIASYQSLNNKEGIIKSNQLSQDNLKLKKQLDQYFQQNKQLRTEVRKYRNQCQRLQKEKQDLVTQNVILLNQVANMKGLIANEKQQRLSQIQTLRSQQIKSQEILRGIHRQPEGNVQKMMEGSPHYIGVSTNPSYPHEGHFPPSRKLGKNEEFYKEFYQNTVNYNDCNPSARSFSNDVISKNLSPSHFQEPNKHIHSPQNINNKVIYSNYNSPIEQLSSVKYHSSHMNSAPQTKLGAKVDERQMNPQGMIANHKFPLNLTGVGQINGAGNTQQKKSLKNEVSELRDGILGQLLNKYYRKAVEEAEQQKTNSFKLFIEYLNPKLQILQKMTLNYLQARESLSVECPTIRQKWQNVSQCDHNSSNNRWVYNVYSSIKNNAKKQKSLAGQYLALFRTLTLLDKFEMPTEQKQKTIDGVLVDNIKHSTIKFIHRAWQEKNKGNAE